MDILFWKSLIIEHEWLLLLLIFILSLSITFILTPQVIIISLKKQLFDDPFDLRKPHKLMIPNLGGVAIFTGNLFSWLTCIPSSMTAQFGVVVASGLVVFLVGLKDDMIPLKPVVKLIAQSLASGLTVVVADFRIVNMNGIFDLYELSYFYSISLTIVFMVGVINAFNLIDGIDGLAASVGLLSSICFSYLFYQAGELGWAMISISLTGALNGFLFFNMSPSRIFMGNSGSYQLGFLAAVLSVRLLHISNHIPIAIPKIELTAEFALVFSILIIPVFDTLRIFMVRVVQKQSPFKADCNHIHHRLLQLGLNHLQTTLVLLTVNVIMICIAVFGQRLGDMTLILIILLLVCLCNVMLSMFLKKKRYLSKKEIILSEAIF
jgi:UDP-GlcNAc:undecaprenyl-phosphate GlcNAc-1-phosphate transferase